MICTLHCAYLELFMDSDCMMCFDEGSLISHLADVSFASYYYHLSFESVLLI